MPLIGSVCQMACQGTLFPHGGGRPLNKSCAAGSLGLVSTCQLGVRDENLGRTRLTPKRPCDLFISFRVLGLGPKEIIWKTSSHHSFRPSTPAQPVFAGSADAPKLFPSLSNDPTKFTSRRPLHTTSRFSSTAQLPCCLTPPLHCFRYPLEAAATTPTPSNMSFLQFFIYLIVGQIGLTIAFYMLSFAVPQAAFVARSLASYMALVFAASYGAVISIFMRLVGQQGSAQWAAGRVFKYIMAATTGVSFEIIDPNHHLDTVRPAVFVGNHQTELDVLMLGSMFPRHCSITAKKSLKSWPVLGWFMTLSGSVFIDRKNTSDARQAMSGAAKEIRDRRQSVYMFPEGTRSYSKDAMLLPFKKGAFHLAVQAGAPIVPVVVANYSHVLYFKKFVFNAGKIPVKG